VPTIYTIGFTQKSAETFFESLRRAGIRRVVDIRLHNSSQLAGFAKQEDLRFFLREICGADYVHELLLAPSPELFDAYKKKGGSWGTYERSFNALLAARQVEETLDRHLFDVPTCLLCSEPTPEHCHRRLVAEYLRDKWDDVEVIHL
jgi:uncharacterized protein (DUF488 family)